MMTRSSRWMAIGVCSLAVVACSLSGGRAEGKPGATSQPGPRGEKTLTLVPNQRLAIGVSAATVDGAVLTVQWARFARGRDSIQANVHMARQSILQGNWKVEVYLLDQDGKPLRMAGRMVKNSGKALGRPGLEEQDWQTSLAIPSPERVKSVRVTAEAVAPQQTK